MAGAMVRISNTSREVLRQLAVRHGATMQATLEAAIEAYRRQRFLEEVNAGYAALREDPDEWAKVQAERTVWDATLADGLPAEAKRGRTQR